jgi:hypothetical protein
MGDHLDRLLQTDIPEELYLSRNVQTMIARATVAGVPTDETIMAILTITVGNMMELEERVVAIEKKIRLNFPTPRDVM